MSATRGRTSLPIKISQPEPVHVLVSLVVAFNFAVAQPLLDLLGKNAPFFVAHDLSTWHVVGLGLLLTLLLPLMGGGLVALLARNYPVVGQAVYIVALFTLMTAFFMALLRGASLLPPAVLVAVAAGIGVILTLVLAYWSRAHRFMRWALIGPPLFLGVFLFASPVTALLSTEDDRNLDVGSVSNPVPIVVVVLDEFPLASLLTSEGRIDAVRYPNFDRLSKIGTWFPNATTVHASTEHALPALLTGMVPISQDALPIPGDHPSTLFEILAEHYEIVAVEPITRLCHLEACSLPEANPSASMSRTPQLRQAAIDVAIVYLHIVTPERMAHRLPPVEEQWGGFAELPQEQGDETTETDRRVLEEEHEDRLRASVEGDPATTFREFTATIGARNEPTLYFGHFMVPHQPWMYLPSGELYVDTPRALPGMRDAKVWGPDEWFTRHAQRRHLLQVEFTDRLIGELLDRLETTGLLEESLLVVTSDHGTTFRTDTRRREVTGDAAGDVAYVPLFIKFPGEVRAVPDEEKPVQTIDIVPTIVEALGVADPPRMDGESVLRESRRAPIVVHGASIVRLPSDAAPLWQAVESKVSQFGSGDRTGLLHFGPHSELVGSKVDGWRGDGASPLALTVLGMEQLDSVDLESGYLPLLVRGPATSKDGQPAEERFVAFSLNGTIAGIAKTTLDRRMDEVRFETLLEPNTLRQGSNELDVYEIIDLDGSPSLLPATLSRR